MRPPAAGRGTRPNRSVRRTPGRALATATALAVALVGWLVLSAPPAAAHDVGGGSLPAPPWLLGYTGAFLVAVTAVALRAGWRAPRLAGALASDAVGASSAGGAAPTDASRRVHAGNVVGLGLLVAVVAAAIVGPDSAAANIAPVAVLVVWWVGLPIVCLVLGDVMRALNPFVPVVALVGRGTGDAASRGSERATGAPSWTGAAFLGVFAWYFVAYHRPGSPRALAVFLLVYAAAAVAGGLRWGRAWLDDGEGFAALSAGVALLSPRRSHGVAAPGLAATMVVWIGTTAFDGFASTPFWADILGSSQGWTRTAFNTVGLVWLIAVVAAVYLMALRLAARAPGTAEGEQPPLAAALGTALVPLAVAWFVSHDLTLLLFEGQNFLALLSDPLAKGWDLFGTINRTIDYSIVQARWVRWAQLGMLAVGHVVAVLLAHEVVARLVGRRTAMRATWAFAATAMTSIVAAALMVLG